MPLCFGTQKTDFFVCKGVYNQNISTQMQLLLTIALFTGVLLVAFFLINIKHIFTGKQFSGTCSQNNPLLTSKIGECGICGKKADEACKMPEVK